MEEREEAILAGAEADGSTYVTERGKPVPQPSYADLIAYVETRRGLSFGEQQALNSASALRQFLEHQVLSADSPVGQELGEGFDDALIAFVKAKTGQAQPRSIANTRSALRQWSKHWHELVASCDEPKFEGLAEAIKHHGQKLQAATGKPFMPGRVSRLAGLGSGYIHALLKANVKTFKANKLENLAKLEELLDAPPTAFTRFVALEREGLAKTFAGKRRTTRFGKQVSELLSDQYRLKDLPPQLLQEVRELIRFKTSVRPPGQLIRNQKWRTKPVGECAATQRVVSIVSLEGKTFSAAAARFLNMVEQFFGVMVQKGHDPNRFSLAWMCDRDLIDTVIEFAAERVGAVTMSTVDLIETIRTLVYEKGGWLYQQPQFASRLYAPTVMPKASWEAWCTETRTHLRDVIANLAKDNLIKKGRDTGEPISDILQRDHPITALLEIVEGMERYLKKYESQPNTMNGIAKAVLQRDIVIFKIMTVQPHRARMMKIMKWTPENTGNLYKRSNGAWAIRFEPEDFKNENGAAKERGYDVALPVALNEEIESYLNNVRPNFKPEGDYVFVPEKRRGRATEGRDTQGGKWLNVMIRYRTRCFLKGCIGFGPHAIRHIVATDYIKNNPGSYLVAAHILHDKLETVLRAYAHLKAADGHRVYQEYLSVITRAWRTV